MGSLDRRGFLKLVTNLPKIAAGVTVGASVSESIKRETQMYQEGLFEVNGIIYQPLYERHTNGPEIPLHPSVNGVFVETNWIHIIVKGNNSNTLCEETHLTQYNDDPENIVNYNSSKSSGESNLYQVLRSQQIPFAYGDVGLSYEFEKSSDYRLFSDIKDRQQFYQGLFVSVSSLLSPQVFKPLDKKQPPSTSRRDFLKLVKTLGIGGFLYGLWKTTGTTKFHNDTVGNIKYAKQQDPINRLLLKLYGLASDLHPETPLIFTRNLFMALKIKQFGEYLKSNNINPVIAYNVGGAHSGIEDYLCLPDDILRHLIVKTAQDYVNRTHQQYQEHTFATRVIQADENGIFHEIKMIKDAKLENMLANRS